MKCYTNKKKQESTTSLIKDLANKFDLKVFREKCIDEDFVLEDDT